MMSDARAFFAARGYLEVETPVRVKTPALEEHIDAEASGDHWLRTSPELHMKRMVCAGYERIFQIGPCFRRGERGERHLPEYAMLEWYRTGATCEDLVPETCALLEAVGGGDAHLSAPPSVLTVSEAFESYAGWDPIPAFDAERFDLDLVEKVEPALAGLPGPVVLTAFPSARAALARCRPDDPRVADRWELYLNGVELANAYTELTDPVEQRRRFEACAAFRREEGRDVYEMDEAFLGALEEGMPACAGIALGMDRFLMYLTGARDIAEVVAFADG